VQGKTIRQAASALGLSHNGVRSHIRDLRAITACTTCDELREWWRLHELPWLAYVARCASGR
jgi:DNA-binding CsgD family transcriptional regulator